jgi:hypothetical protein
MERTHNLYPAWMKPCSSYIYRKPPCTTQADHETMGAKIHRKSTWPALVLLVAWLVIAGGLTWLRSRESVLPPVFDQMTYVQKAEGIWGSVLKGNRVNPLNIEPSVRPPGTVVLTAPFGPLQDVRNFYFRSVFVPVVIMAIAVFLVGVGVTGQGWYSALIAMIASSMPMFWQLEFMDTQNTGYFWGLVDTFQASLAGLAMSGLVLAALRYKRRWLIPGFISLGLLPLIKPSGFLIGSLIALAWLVLAVGWANSHPRGPLRSWSELVTTGISITLIFGCVLLASLGSKYFSAENIEFGRLALKDLRGEIYSEYTLKGFKTLLTSTIGLPQLITIALLGFSSRARKSIRKDESYHNEARWMGAVGILIFLAGIAITYQAEQPPDKVKYRQVPGNFVTSLHAGEGRT